MSDAAAKLYGFHQGDTLQALKRIYWLLKPENCAEKESATALSLDL